MATTKMGELPVTTSGELPQVGTTAPDFSLVTNDLKEVSLKDYAGKTIVLNIFPSIDTRVCAMSVRQFNQTASAMDNVIVLAIAKDLPFAMKRFCGAEGIDKVVTLSDFRNKGFSKSYGIDMIDGPFEGLHARAIVVISPEGRVKYTELVPLIGQEPNYENAIAAI